jgi:hypothetical protein
VNVTLKEAFAKGAAAARTQALEHFGAGRSMKALRQQPLPEPGPVWGELVDDQAVDGHIVGTEA